jgi:heme oxygenase
MGEAILGNVRQQLRHATAPVHEAMHGYPGFARLLDGRLTISEYRALLARLYGFHWALERQLRSTPREILGDFDARSRERAPELRADLSFVGMPRKEIDALPLCEALRPVGSNAELFGRLYVVEGAGLGGHVMVRKLGVVLGDQTMDGRQFFGGRPPPDPLPWPKFCELLESRAECADLGAVIAGAERTFLALAQWLREGELND